MRARAARLGGGAYFDTFLDRASLAAGILVLRPGELDTQGPHGEDEVYYVISGDGFLRVRGRDYEARAGKAFFVPAGAEHRFHGNRRELRALYFFGGRR